MLGGGSVLGCYGRVPGFTDTEKRITFGTKCNSERKTMLNVNEITIFLFQEPL